MAKVKITVLKGLTYREIFRDDIPEHLPYKDPDTKCKQHVAGQEFISENHSCPEGFCNWAFADFQDFLVYLDLGNNYYGSGKPGYVACTSGTAPVIFKLERIE